MRPGQKTTVILEGSFSPETTILINGKRLTRMVGLGKPVQHAAEDCDIVGQGQPCDQALLRIGEMAEMHGMANETPIGLGDRLLR